MSNFKAEQKLGKKAVARLRRTFHNGTIFTYERTIKQLGRRLAALQQWRDSKIDDNELVKEFEKTGGTRCDALPWDETSKKD